jgi:ribonuclease D
MSKFQQGPPKSITKEEINQLPMLYYEGKIEIIETKAAALEAIKKLSNEKLLGFDTETRPSFHKGESYQVALVQLATENCAYLFRLNKMPLLEELVEVLSNPDIIKAGVGIQDDLKGLQKMVSFNAQGFVDIGKEAERRGFSGLGLRTLSAIFLGKRLSKGAKVTNWERVILTEAQLNYAANDANVGLRLYQKIMTS